MATTTIVTKVTMVEIKATEVNKAIMVTVATGEVNRTGTTIRTEIMGIVGVTTRITGEVIEGDITESIKSQLEAGFGRQC